MKTDVPDRRIALVMMATISARLVFDHMMHTYVGLPKNVDLYIVEEPKNKNRSVHPDFRNGGAGLLNIDDAPELIEERDYTHYILLLNGAVVDSLLTIGASAALRAHRDDAPAAVYFVRDAAVREVREARWQDLSEHPFFKPHLSN
jgi:hypothetical protein